MSKSNLSQASFRYEYETSREEFIDGCLPMFDGTIAEQSKWRPPVLPLFIGGLAGGLASGVAESVPGKLAIILVPIAVMALLSITSKETRINNTKARFAKVLSKNYDQKKCHSHNLQLDENGFIETCPCGTDTRTWQSVKKWHETEQMIVLEAQARMCYALPKRVIPPEELASLRDLISRHVRSAAETSPASNAR